MIKVIEAEKRHFTDMGWLKTYWIFSFADYHDPSNVQHGMLRVFNDDVVAPRSGFDIHPHNEMEIVSIILTGEMEHQDTMGNRTVLRQNDVQRMTAGTGLQHSEKNRSDNPVHFFQIWIKPDKVGLTPSYHQLSFSPETWRNKLSLVATSHEIKNTVRLNSEGSIYRAALDVGHTELYKPAVDRKIFIYIIKGSISANDVQLKIGDQGRVSSEEAVRFSANENSEFILIDVPSEPHFQ